MLEETILITSVQTEEIRKYTRQFLQLIINEKSETETCITGSKELISHFALALYHIARRKKYIYKLEYL